MSQDVDLRTESSPPARPWVLRDTDRVAFTAWVALLICLLGLGCIVRGASAGRWFPVAFGIVTVAGNAVVFLQSRREYTVIDKGAVAVHWFRKTIRIDRREITAVLVSRPSDAGTRGRGRRVRRQFGTLAVGTSGGDRVQLAGVLRRDVDELQALAEEVGRQLGVAVSDAGDSIGGSIGSSGSMWARMTNPGLAVVYVVTLLSVLIGFTNPFPHLASTSRFPYVRIDDPALDVHPPAIVLHGTSGVTLAVGGQVVIDAGGVSAGSLLITDHRSVPVALTCTLIRPGTHAPPVVESLIGPVLPGQTYRYFAFGSLLSTAHRTDVTCTVEPT